MEYYPQLKILSKGKGGCNQGFRKEILNTIFTAVLQRCVLRLCQNILFFFLHIHVAICLVCERITDLKPSPT